MNGPEGEACRAFWLRCLEEAPPPLALGDRTPPSPRRYEANTLHTRLEASLCRRLRERARQHAATAFQVLLAALSAMLYRVGGQNRFVVCIPYASQSLDRHGPLMADGVLDLPLLID
ncbi:condensation domain-containing protein, partial [Vibrio parahaemolyticus]